MVVVDSEGASAGRHGIWLSTRALPGRMDTMNIKIGMLYYKCRSIPVEEVAKCLEADSLESSSRR